MTTTEPRMQRENLCRAVPFKAADSQTGDGLTFTGYAAVFNAPTRINSMFEGEFDELIAPGAFRKSLSERTPRFQFNHGKGSIIGEAPIGVIKDIREDEQGLFVEARLLRHLFVDLIREGIAEGAIDGMSFRFSVVRDEWRDRDGKLVQQRDVEDILFYGAQAERKPLLRTLKEVKVTEVGPVVWPAYADTTADVRSDEPIILYRDRLGEPGQRKLLAEAVLRAEAADAAEHQQSSPPVVGDSSDDEPQDTTRSGVAVEHSVEDTDPPQPTPERAGEHASATETENPPPATDADELFTQALAEVRTAREATPPMKGK
jgi:HK97 family phage prohead protease